MSIMLRCSCGKQSNLPGSFVGKRVRCNFCGALTLVTERVPDHPELDWETHVAESLLTSADGPATATEVLEAEPAVEAPELFEEVPSGETAAVAPEPVVTVPRAEGAKEYKVLTQRDRMFGGKFDAERLEHALNFLAGQGWAVKSMAAGSLISGNREELVVLLERG